MEGENESEKTKINNISTVAQKSTAHEEIFNVPDDTACFIQQILPDQSAEMRILEEETNYLLQPGDVVLADRGFTVHDIVEAKQAHLNIPPFLNGRDRLTPQEEMSPKKIAKQRIYVEHVIGRIKKFRLLQTVLPLNMRTLMSQIIFVCACLVNFQTPLVFDEEE
ncbi:uncharacterized protein LOC124301615 [Neodiprion virginianus]|uniref:uncharacterized protein LOC124301615 n=1 Tax=Neodiprion virginianus TaxID=2961670 RepID=UPI001EE6F1B2|nr:uncharacterized protein LOC124301615 [Neodiprion virginianus]